MTRLKRDDMHEELSEMILKVVLDDLSKSGNRVVHVDLPFFHVGLGQTVDISIDGNIRGNFKLKGNSARVALERFQEIKQKFHKASLLEGAHDKIAKLEGELAVLKQAIEKLEEP